MKIDSYSFGRIVIDGKEFDKDVIILNDSVEGWIREDSHNIEPSDIDVVDKEKPEVIIIGTGSSGIMHVPERTITFIKNKDIGLVIQNTHDAVKTFNETDKRKVAFLHLTC